MTSFFSARLAGGFLLVVLGLTGTGCNREKATGKVTGKVTYNGNPVTSGNVNFISAKGVAASSKIDAFGGFEIESPIVAGEYQVFVSPPTPEPVAPGAKVESLPRFTVPNRFREPASSGVTVVLKRGKNDVPVELRD